MSDMLGPTEAVGRLMNAEAADSGAAVARMLTANRAVVGEIAARLRRTPPAFVLSVGRGTSDHAGVYAKYLIEQRLGIVAAAAGLSLGSVYGGEVALSGALCLAISQSGRSPDLVAMLALARRSGARTLALVNADGSPLAAEADDVLPLCAGVERSVAATKSFVAAAAAIALLVGHWAEDEALLAAVEDLPNLLDRSWALDWMPVVDRLVASDSMFVLGRGASYAVAREAALKLKETSVLHAEAFSSAEVLHGPAALAGHGYPILAFCQDDAARPSMEATLAVLRDRGADLFVAGPDVPGTTALPTLHAHPLLQPIAMAVSFYRAAGALAAARGLDPDRPPYLSKVTETH